MKGWANRDYTMATAVQNFGRPKKVGEGRTCHNGSLDLVYDIPSALITMFGKALGRTPGLYSEE